MLIDKYTKYSVFSLPLIFYGILNKSDLKDNEFVNMYTCDTNKPYLSNHIFLVFHNIKDSSLKRLRSHCNFETDYDILVDSILYKVVCFTRDFPIQNIINFVNKGKYIDFIFCSKMKILRFWDATARDNPKLFQYLFDEEFIPEKPVNEVITTEDTKKKPVV